MAASRAQGAAQRYLNRFGIKLAYWPILLSLSQGGEKTQVELAAQVDRTTAAVSLILGEMEREGLVTRRTNPDSRREVLVALTRLGQEKWADLMLMGDHPPKVGDYVVIELGFVQRVIPEADALESHALFREIHAALDSGD